jgi:hypothetical protein
MAIGTSGQDSYFCAGATLLDQTRSKLFILKADTNSKKEVNSHKSNFRLNFCKSNKSFLNGHAFLHI